MRLAPRFQHLLSRIALLITAGLALAQPLTGQTFDLQIMVNGSWDYVVDPHPEKDPNQNGQKQNRIAIVAPVTVGHMATIFYATGANKFKGQPELQKGLYYVDIDRALRTGKGKRSQVDLAPAAYPLPKMSQKRIEDIFTANPPMPRIAISLPKPDYFTTYGGPDGAGPHDEGTSEARIGKVPTGSLASRAEYTTWMVLHYQVTGSSSATVSNSADDGVSPPTRSIPFDQHSPSFNIVMGATTDGDTRCDMMSLNSFKQSKKLWGNPMIFARFPEPADQVGHQHRGTYHLWCFDPESAGFSIAESKFMNAKGNVTNTTDAIGRLKAEITAANRGSARGEAALTTDAAKQDIELVRKSLDDLALGHLPKKVSSELTCLAEVVNRRLPIACPNKRVPTEQVIGEYLADLAQLARTAVGGADCHKAQFNINAAIQ